METVTGVVLGVVALSGALALVKLARRARRELQNILNEGSRVDTETNSGELLDYERDPQTGVFRPKP